MAEFNNFFPGQYIDAENLNFDNVSHRDELSQRFNVIVDVPGVANGYANSLGIIPGSLPDTITVLDGVAFDSTGRLVEITSSDTNRINIPFANIIGLTYLVKAKYKQLFLEPEYDPETGVGPDSTNPEIPYFTKIQDYYEVSISTDPLTESEIELGRIIGQGSGNIVSANLIDITQRKAATIKGTFLTDIDHTTLKNIGVLTHTQLDARVNQLFTDVGLVPTSDGTPSLSIPLSELIGNIFDHNHSGDGEGARIDHNSLLNVHPDQHHKKIHKHSKDPGTADSNSDDGFVEKINLDDSGAEPLEVRGKLSGSNIKDATLSNTHIEAVAGIDQTKIDNSEIYEDNFAGVPSDLQQDLNQLRTQVKNIKFGPDPSKRFNDPADSNISILNGYLTTKFEGLLGHKHTGVDGDGPKLTDQSIAPKSLTAASIHDNTIVNSLVSPTAAIDESKINLEDSYAWRNYVISGGGIEDFTSGALTLIQPLVITNVGCTRKVNAIISGGVLNLNPGDVIFVEWPETHDDTQPLTIQSTTSFPVTITKDTVVLGEVNENDNRLYVNWGHNPFHRHTGAPGDYEQIDINASTVGILAINRLPATVAKLSDIDSAINAHNTSATAHPDIRAALDPSTTPFIVKSGDTMNGNLTFPNGKKLIFKNSTNQSAYFNRVNSSPSTEVNLQLVLGTNASTNPRLEIGQIVSSNFVPNLILHGDDGSITSSGTIHTSGKIGGDSLTLQTGIIKGKSLSRMTDNIITSSGLQLVLNPVGDFPAGTKVQGVLHSDQLQFADQIVEKDSTLNAVAFNHLVSADDFYIRNINRTASDLILQILSQAVEFRKEILQRGANIFITLNEAPTPNSTTLTFNNGTLTTILNEAADYTISGKVITFTNPGSIGASDDIYIKYAVNGGLNVSLTISSIQTPNSTIASGDTIIIQGFGLEGVTSLLFGSAPATSFTINSSYQITAIAPAGPPSGATDVTINSSTASFTSIGGVTYT
jgi:hypothetical protein